MLQTDIRNQERLLLQKKLISVLAVKETGKGGEERIGKAIVMRDKCEPI